MRRAIYPGTFDPITKGHLDIIERSAKIFDEIIVVIMHNANKTCMFSEAERLSMIQEIVKDINNVSCVIDDGLAVDCAIAHDASLIIRGIREVADYEYEVRIAATNAFLDPSIETLFLLSDAKYSFISSSAVKEIALYKDNLEQFVPSYVALKMKEKLHHL
ncbi:MAG: pantetheine-phosphate adenylyltransferase [Erysipelotrichaceae bacterium]